MATANTPPTTPKTSTSTDPLYTAAVAQAKQALAAETAPVKAEQSASDAQFQQRETDETGVSSALSKLLQGIGPAVNGMYQTAAQNQELAGAGFSQGMQDALKGNTDNLNAMLQSLNSPAQLDSHASQAGDMLYALGGYNPGVAFSKEGAAFGSAAELQAGDAILHGQENVKSLKAQAIVADQGFQSKIAEMAGKLPGDVQTNYQHLQQLALDDAKFRESVRKDNFDMAMKQADEKLAYAKYTTDVQYKNAQLKLSAQRNQLTAQRMANQQFNADRNYQAKLAGLGIQEKRLQLSIMASSFKAANGGLTKQQVDKYTSQAQSIAMQGANGYTTYTTKNGVKTPQHTGQVSYFEALGQALKKGIPVQIALDALDRVYPPQYRPSAQALAAQLGPLDPAAMKVVAQQQVAAGRRQGVSIQQQDNTNALYPASAGKTVLATGPNGQKVSIQMPQNLSPATRKVLSNVLGMAVEYLGTPYAWGGESPTGFDCSGLAQYVYAKAGVQIPRTTYEQFQSGYSVGKGQLQAGDLVFFKGSDSKNGLPGHVGIYIGNGMMIQAPHTGDVVKVSSVSGFPGYMGARRYTRG